MVVPGDYLLYTCAYDMFILVYCAQDMFVDNRAVMFELVYGNTYLYVLLIYWTQA